MVFSNIIRNFGRITRHHGADLLSPSCRSWALGSVPTQRLMSDLTKQFESAKDRLGSLSEDPGNEAKLKIYALFKQSTVGAVNTSRPGMMDFVGRAKWDAWNKLGKMSQDEAKQSYIDFIGSLVGEEESASANAEPSKYKGFEVTVNEGLRVVRLNRPKKFNAITFEMYNEWVDILNEAAEDKKTVVTAITGNGDYFCSGNDLSNFMNIPPDGMQKMADDGKEILDRFVKAFIDFPKPLIGVINGPAIGVSVTTLALYDAVYCSDKATFNTPFSKLGQSPEGCSSYTFPKMMGPGLASEMLLFNRKLSAQEAKSANLVTEVYSHETINQEIWPKLEAYAKLPVKSLVYSKALNRGRERETLLQVMETENERLRERWLSDDCINAIMSFFNK